ncbi:MAG TPA: family 1 glycosylhydrolase [Ohtaekwangia sp.]|nr:family 1 glycosylhydrolase [Ohtaekwangia sp.]
MTISFPADFMFGTSTAAYQIETAVDHDWQGIRALDGSVFDTTTDHEKRHAEDIEIIQSLAPHYRMSLMWSKLQSAPFAPLNKRGLDEYHALLHGLRQRNVRIMMVLHHFANPLWFAKLGGWEKASNIPLWTAYAKAVVNEFGTYVDSWNTFNEPNLYTSLGWVAAEFPPYRRNLLAAHRVINNIARAHEELYRYIRTKYPGAPVGISHNSAVFKPRNLAGQIPAAIFDWCFMSYPVSLFRSLDFFGLSYYARIDFDPRPVTQLRSPGKIRALQKPHDDLWEYYPEGLGECIRRFWDQFHLPVIITENGICTPDDQKRVKAIRDYMRVIRTCMDEGIDIRGYYHWTAWDNFEWSLGPSFKFGLYACDREHRTRTAKPSAKLFSSLAYNREITL